MVAETVEKTIEERKAELLNEIGTAARAGDLTKVAELAKAISQLAKDVEHEGKTSAQASARAEVKSALEAGLKKINLREIMRNLVLTATVKRSATGLDNIAVKCDVPVGLLDLLKPAIGASGAVGVDSIRAITALIGANSATVELSTKGSTGAKGTGGGVAKQWTNGAGEVTKLSVIFDAHATGEEKAQYENLKGDGNAQYGLRKTVAARAGYKVNK